ncbi:MAG: O-antigen ligase family protein [Vicinamibacteria bacterium]
MRVEAVVRAVRLGAFTSVLVAPFLFGAVERSIWIPLCQLWIALGIISFSLTLADPTRGTPSGRSAFVALLPVHLLFLIQLCPLPGFILRFISPGSYAAYFLPDLHDGKWRPITVSMGATLEAWIYVAGLQSIFSIMQGFSAQARRQATHLLLLLSLVVAIEGLWQSRSEHPDWTYGLIPVAAPLGLQNAGFGLYLNRNHFATMSAIGAALAAGLGMSAFKRRKGGHPLLHDQNELAWIISMGGTTGLLLLATASSGSRSGLLAAIFGIGVAITGRIERRSVLISIGGVVALALGVILSGAAAVERFLQASTISIRVPAWLDIITITRFFPAFGAGIGTFAAAYWPYQMNARYEFWQHAHNEYIEWIVEGGVVGLAVAFVALREFRARYQIEELQLEPLKSVLAAFAFQAFFDFPARIPANAAFVVSLVALTLVPRRKSGESRLRLEDGHSEDETRACKE